MISKFFKAIIILSLSLSAYAEDSSDQALNELSFGITVSANGSLTSASGMHTLFLETWVQTLKKVRSTITL